MVQSPNEILLSNKKDRINDKNNMDECQMHYAKLKILLPYIKGYV